MKQINITNSHAVMQCIQSETTAISIIGYSSMISAHLPTYCSRDAQMWPIYVAIFSVVLVPHVYMTDYNYLYTAYCIVQLHLA